MMDPAQGSTPQGVSLTSGMVIDARYRLLEPLGQGRFGVTWLALDEGTGGQVAIKLLEMAALDRWKTLELFEREAAVLRSLDHPNIPSFLAFSPPCSEALGYIVQEVAPGLTLESMRESGHSWQQEHLEAIIYQALDTLTYIHEQNPCLIHQDITPSNLLWDTKTQKLSLVDFGAIFDASQSRGSTLIGTFGYGAPEQFRGEAHPASDLHGLGMTLVALITGKEPHTLPQKRMVLCLDGYRSDLSPWLMAWLKSLTSPMPEDRPHSAAKALFEFKRAHTHQALIPMKNKEGLISPQSDDTALYLILVSVAVGWLFCLGAVCLVPLGLSPLNQVTLLATCTLAGPLCIHGTINWYRRF